MADPTTFEFSRYPALVKPPEPSRACDFNGLKQLVAVGSAINFLVLRAAAAGDCAADGLLKLCPQLAVRHQYRTVNYH
jgi:hypothetical protein